MPEIAPGADPNTKPETESAAPDRRHYACLLILLGYLPMIGMGYGHEIDTYGALRSGRLFLTGGGYHASRPPGFFLYENIAALLAWAGGPYASNLFSVLAVGVAAIALIDICGRWQIANAGPIAALMLVNPYMAIAGSTTMDYAPAIASLLVAAAALGRRRFLLAGVAAGVATGFRCTSLLVGLALGIGWWVARKEDRRGLLRSAAVAAPIIALCYLPPLLSAGLGMFRSNHTFGTEQLSIGFAFRLGKFLYKNVYLIGPVAAAYLAVWLAAVRPRLSWSALGLSWSALAIACLAAIALEEAMFWDVPAKYFYILPCLPFALLLLGLTKLNRVAVIAPLIGLVALSGFLDFSLARPNATNHATSARVGFHMAPGALILQVRERRVFEGCDTTECWLSREPELKKLEQ